MTEIEESPWSVVGEHEQKQPEERNRTESSIDRRLVPSLSTSSTLIHHQGEKQQRFLSSNSMKTIGSDNAEDDGTITVNSHSENLRSHDTVFVKEVRTDSPAYQAGLRPGDRILSVNDQSITGKAYAQVVALIQNTTNDLTLSVLSRESENISLSFNEPSSSVQSASAYCPSTTIMSKNTIEQKLRSLQLNLAQGRTQEELAKAGIFFLPPGASSSQNVFSNYIDSVHKALDGSKQSTSDGAALYYPTSYHNEYVPYDYKQEVNSSFIGLTKSPVTLTSEEQTSWSGSTLSPRKEIKSPSTDSCSQDKGSASDNDMKSEFVNFRKKQFETGHVENLVHDSQRESKTKKYSEKKKYENEWNHLTAVSDVESVMKRAAHFEDIDPDKFARLKSKYPNSPSPKETSATREEFSNEIHPNELNFYDVQAQFPYKQLKVTSKTFDPTVLPILKADDSNIMRFTYDPRYAIESVKTSQSEPTTMLSNYAALKPSEKLISQRYPLDVYSAASPSHIDGINLSRHDSYITAVRPNNANQCGSFVHLHDFGKLDFSFIPETPILRRKVPRYGTTPEVSSEQELKQRRTSYLIATEQRVAPHPENYLPTDFATRPQNQIYSYGFDRGEVEQQQQQQEYKLRNAPQYQTQAIKKLKNFFGEGTPEVTHALDHRSTQKSSLPSVNPAKSAFYFESSTRNPRESLSLTTLVDNLEPSKEGILYCKTVLKEGRRATDRSWRGAWAVLRRDGLFLGKEKKHGLLIPLSCESFPISLQDADVELANDYIKKPRVFKLIASNQSEYLFQAPDLQSLTEWLDAIKENCFSSQAKRDDQQLHRDQPTVEQPQGKCPPSLRPPPATSSHHAQTKQTALCPNEEPPKVSPSHGRKSKISVRSPSLKRSPSLRLRKSQKSSIAQPSQPMAPLSGLNSPSTVSPRRSFVKSIVKKGLRTLKSSSSLLTSQMSGQIYDESSGESLSSTSGTCTVSQGINFGIELEECESSSVSRFIPIVVEILTRLVELRGITCQGIYRHAGGLTAVHWLVHELDKGAENIDFDSDKWYDVKAVASTLKTFFAKLPDSLLSSKMSSLCVEASRVENHCDRLIEVKRIISQLEDHRFETLKYLCAHFRRITAKCHINKIDARNLAIIFGPTLIWDSKASLQANLVDNPEKIRIVESLILYYEWFFDHAEYDKVPNEINPQMPNLPLVVTVGNVDPEVSSSNETKPSDIIQQIVRAAKRRWSSPLLLDSLSSLSTTAEPQTSKAISISMKSRNRRHETKEDKSSRSRSVDSSLNEKQQSNPTVSSSTDSAVYSMSDISSSIGTTIKKSSQSLKDISHFFQYFTTSNERTKSKTLTNIRKKRLRKKLTNETFIAPVIKDDDIYERISNSSICFIDQSPNHEVDIVQQTSLLKSKLIQHENILRSLRQQIGHVDQQLLTMQLESTANHHELHLSSPSNRQSIKRRHTFNSVFDLNCLFTEKDKCSSSSLYALQLL